MRCWHVLGLLAVLPSACTSDDARPARTLPSDAGLEAAPDGADGAVHAREASPLPEEAGKDAEVEAAAAADASDASAGPYPPLLSLTGLYSDVATEALAPGVRPFEPRYTLWSDGATKRRWVMLPEGTTIDTSAMDFWEYPVGTRAWKEFSRDGVRLETRLLHKAAEGWVRIAYAWREDGTDAEAVPEGRTSVRGTDHDIPSQEQCEQCHGRMADTLLGLSAIQLSHGRPGVTLTTLSDEGRLSDPPPGLFTLPGDEITEGALGYLHANCGTCHNPRSSVSISVALELWESTERLGSLEETTAFVSAVGQPNAYSTFLTIDPGRPDTSALLERMSVRGNNQMPPLGTKHVDPDGVAMVRELIGSLPPLPDSG